MTFWVNIQHRGGRGTTGETDMLWLRFSLYVSLNEREEEREE
jgi:hypothetical protein